MEIWDIIFNSLYAVILVTVIFLIISIIRLITQTTEVVGTVNKELQTVLDTLRRVNSILEVVEKQVKKISENPLWEKVLSFGLIAGKIFQKVKKN